MRGRAGLDQLLTAGRAPRVGGAPPDRWSRTAPLGRRRGYHLGAHRHAARRRAAPHHDRWHDDERPRRAAFFPPGRGGGGGLAAPGDGSVVGHRSKPALGYAKGQVVLPRGAPFLLRVRSASADSVRILIGRVADTARGSALSYASEAWQNGLWSKRATDSVRQVVAVPADSIREQIVDVPERWVPESW